MPTKQRAQPDIPDHEVLRKIGGGAYGEVWMARGITGAYRAVKVVWREDFDDERSFEREFEGILKFEPISRDHPGLVNILHVGRSKDSVSFYYYVMELGDDVMTGREINAVEYEARTLRSDIKHARGKAQDVALCIESGIRLADALEHLHERGLAHRDVKPANVIFVNGKAKLADIGLVADRGQMTFVGTEGFVPPEGPGSAQADVYSLGKVLYEVATGKDRLQFPEVPEELHPDTELKQWLALNKVLCDICEPKISKRTITSSSQLAIALRRIGAGKKLSSGKGALNGVLWMALLGFTGYAIYLALPYIENWDGWAKKPIEVNPDPIGGAVTPGNDPVVEIPTVKIPKKKICIVNFYVNPDDAEVYTPEGQWMGNVESYLRDRQEEVGTEIHVWLRKDGYEDLEVFYVVPDEEYHFPEHTMKLDQPPQPGDQWWDVLGNMYLPGKDKSRPTNKVHESEPVSDVMWELYSERKDVSSVALKYSNFKSDKKDNRVVCVAKQDAEAMAEWLTEESIKAGRLKPSQQIVALHGWEHVENTRSNSNNSPTELAPFRLMARYIPYASIELRTQPKGAKVWIDGDFRGLTDNTFQEIPPGKWVIKIEKDGYESFEKTFTFGEDELLTPDGIKLKINDSLITGKPWLRKSGMKFVPVTENLMASAFETRVKDFQEYIDAQNKAGANIEMPVPTRNKDADEPVVHVTYDDAVKYADWLTERDRESGQISRSHTYRLPTDTEWSLLVGIQEVDEMGIAKRALKHKDALPWEGNWTVKNKKLVALTGEADPIGNFSDETRKKYNPKLGKYFKEYTDGESGTAAVGQYKANGLGIHDLAGNVSEMLSNTVGSNNLRVVRGSNFKSYLIKDLRSSYRTYLGNGDSTDSIGFRLVIEYREEEAAELVGDEAAGESDE